MNADPSPAAPTPGSSATPEPGEPTTEPEQARYSAMRWNAPLSEEHADRLLGRLGLERAATIVDLGCGWGELLLRAVAAGTPDCRGIGVDNDVPLLERGRAAARRRGLEHRVSFIEGDISTWSHPAEVEVVLCIGASHAWGGSAAALTALRSILAPGGRLLYGDGVWATEPNDEALGIFGDDVLTPETLRRAAAEAGFSTVAVADASIDEWDEFEASFRAGRERWAAANPRHPRAAEITAEMRARRHEYETVYRGVLGFTYLVLSTPA